MTTAVETLRLRSQDQHADVFLVAPDGNRTYVEAHDGVERLAAGLFRRGVKPGDRVCIFASNSADNVIAWLAVNALGAIDVPINVDATGAFLRYLLEDAGPVAVICSADRLSGIAPMLSDLRGHRPFVVVIGEFEPAQDWPSLEVVALAELMGESLWEPVPPPLDRTTATVMYTSGTTGASKGVLLPHGYYTRFGELTGSRLRMQSHDRVYCVQPLFHIDARLSVMAALTTGASAVIGQRFSPRNFWRELRTAGCTRFLYIGTMVWLLYKLEASEDDRGPDLLIGLGSATPPEIRQEFEARFGCALIEAYGLTEAVLLTTDPPSGGRPGTVGTATPDIELCVLDDDDTPLPAGKTGEIAFRPRQADVVAQGYWNNEKATVAAWRSLWFHTGDLGILDADGFLTYVGRNKDSIRRRGENISAWEVEQALSSHPAVLEVAVVGIPSDVGDEDVAALVVLKPGTGASPEELCTLAAANLAYFMVPRYVEFVPSLPKTPSERIAKALVRERGLTAAAWDAEAIGWRAPGRRSPT